MRPDRVAIEGQIVRVENRELWSVLGPAGVVAGVQELGEREHGGAVVRDPRLGHAQADEAQLLELRGERHERGAPLGDAE